MKTHCLLLIVAAVATSLCQPLATAVSVEHVIVVGCDGMGSLALRSNPPPVLTRLMAEGAWTLEARGVMPTVSSPNWASMIMGAGPEQHGVTSNEWETNKFNFAPIEAGPEGMFPTMFGALRKGRPNAVIACVHDWDGFGRLLERSAMNYLTNVSPSEKTAVNAVSVIGAMKPTLLFIHFDSVDHAGHEKGWKSAEFFIAVRAVDRLIGQVLDAVRTAGIEDSTLILVTADHGGKGTHHGGESMDELLIPWILHGPGIRRGRLTAPVNTYDTAPTVLAALRVEAPRVWIGRPVSEAFSAP